MKEGQVEAALSIAAADQPIGKCELSRAVISFLDELEQYASWWQKLGIGAVRSAVSNWRNKNGCLNAG